MDKNGTVVCDVECLTSEHDLASTFCAIDGTLKVHLEACELAGWARVLLLERVPQVEEVIAGHGKSNAWVANDPLKGDGIDAWKLADLIRQGRVHPVFYPEDENLAIFKKTVQHYEDITEQQSTLKQKIEARLRVEGIIANGSLPFSESGRQLLLGDLENPFIRERIEHLYRLHDHAVAAQEEAFELMKRQSKRFPIIDRLRQIPGIERRLACRFVGYIQNPHRFATKEKLWRYSRLGITDRSSNNKKLGYQRLDHNGVGKLKDLSCKAFQAAMSCTESNMFQRFHSASLERTHNADHARLNTQRKILTVMWTIWRKGTRYDDNMG
jgi:hypothetical protein